MARDFNINGPAMVYVRFGEHVSPDLSNIAGSQTNRSELGLSPEQIEVEPVYHHTDIVPDDFGPRAPAEVLTSLAEVRVRMTLIHYDADILDACLAEASAMNGEDLFAGVLAPAGAPLGGNRPLLSSGCHYVSLGIASPEFDFPWRFPAAYLAQRPAIIPLGTGASVARLEWRAVPYQPFTATGGYAGDYETDGPVGATFRAEPATVTEVLSSGVVLWDHRVDN